ncbi:TPA: hypothetical protein DDW69_03635 [candidate division CPR2 bacterium]|uniref:Chromosome partition protein Smc n=1 Tax=candidate division CPR2 bacterium GW2011_GWC1_41_48 TaxID=1618344 RepID=A0A0G0W7N2_UNCC2|nr:MAG: Chromosome partition protein Smc [candidate division CPR2 bacterium GW2011_GWC2_39_35]KKR29364.1 MAG: Chromosome partition protein Smc [candidate division CPR2 bacterium GW2011_GWD2_39_7]KKS09019.1 MAG: Chromosome partition protein Smc [candidate division CPR2 bacterium GW2011_GWC1_41_48]OGB71186.1 MAG: hypothetical protein A2Y26_04210 [candidate division CPR2 bacterium GWD2_39_7]HBG81906.1 hypothetical protein [candidate division CPR2 bacterium]
MYLKKIELFGFKSFAGKYSLDFEPGIVGVVGPNGSGKSNISDAIRWVLGEQSYKLLRAKKSEDVIFAGSAKKSRSSFAEVSLLFDNSDNKAPIDFNEVSISRRLYRNGDNEYMINGKKARLFDIQELLAKAGFGRSSYSVIGQGMVDQFLFLGAEERKAFFSEAAQVKQFELQKDQAVRKLSATEQNLVRVQDIVTELEPRLRVLKSQFKRAEAREEFVNELTGLQEKYYAAVWGEIDSKLLINKENFNELDKEAASIKKELDQINKELDESLSKERQKVENLRKLRLELEQKLAQRESIRGRQIQISSQLEVKRVLANLNTKELEKDIEKLNIRLKDVSFIIGNLQSELYEETTKLHGAEERLKDLNESARKKQDQRLESLKNLRAEIDKNVREKEDIREKYLQVSSKLDVNRAMTGVSLKDLENLAHEKKSKLDDLIKEMGNLVKELESKVSGLEEAENRLEETNDKLKNYEEIIQNLKKETKFDQLAFADEFNVFYDLFLSLIAKVQNVGSFDELSGLKSLLADTEKKLKDLLGKVKPEKSDTFNKIVDLEKEINSKVRVKQELYEQIDLFRSEASKIKAVVSAKEFEEKNINEEIRQLNEKINKIRGAGKEISELEKNLSELKTDLDKKEKEINTLKEELREVEKEEDINGSSNLRQEIYSLIDAFRADISGVKMDVRAREAEKRELSEEIEKLKGKMQDSVEANKEVNEISSFSEGLKKELDLKEKEIEKQRDELNKVEGEGLRSEGTSELTSKIRSKQSLIHEIEGQISSLKIEIAKLETKKDDLEYEAKKELGTTFVENLESGKIKIVDLPKDIFLDLERKIEKLNIKVISIGDIDPLVREEYMEVDERYVFLSGQLVDLSRAKEDLSKVIEELDRQIKNQFNAAFNKIAQNFSRYFEILFVGGKAELKIDAEGNIDISAKPPGKRMDNINALSGGERTLTALSLLAAILDLNPSPFVVLDEVDAALDESNTERFLKIIKELSKKTQFVFITHNRETMKVTDILYGVTMDENHISSLLSVKLENVG